MTNAPTHPGGSREPHLAAARRGDHEAFRRLVEPHRTELHAHCYRMLGSVHDAEDALQEALLRAWRGLPRFEGRSSVRSWLYAISTNTCLDAVARRGKRVLPVDFGPAAQLHDDPGEPLGESIWLEPYPDVLGLEDAQAAPAARYEQRESLELAFVAALQHLVPRQRAVLILRDVLGFTAREVAELLETTEASVNSALQRAHKAVDALLPEQTQQDTLKDLGEDGLRRLVETYMDAMERGDVDAVLALLTEDATWSMPPAPRWYRGREIVTAFLLDYPLSVRWRHLATSANGQAAVGCYLWDADRGVYAGGILDVLTLRGDKIAAITAFHAPDVCSRFGLPAELPAA